MDTLYEKRRSRSVVEKWMGPLLRHCFIAQKRRWACNRLFFWTNLDNIHQLGIGDFLSFEPNSWSFFSKFLSFFSKTPEFYFQGGLFSWHLEFYPSILSFHQFRQKIYNFTRHYHKKCYHSLGKRSANGKNQGFFSPFSSLKFFFATFLKDFLSFLENLLEFFSQLEFFSLEFFFGRKKA